MIFIKHYKSNYDFLGVQIYLNFIYLIYKIKCLVPLSATVLKLFSIHSFISLTYFKNLFKLLSYSTHALKFSLLEYTPLFFDFYLAALYGIIISR